ncbi:MAG: hypothetical protein ACR2J5_07855 [Geodermatophilaceae bacterium]
MEPTDEGRKLLHQVAETHHTVYRITDGTDDDWATSYADWLVRLSELPDVLGQRPIRSDLTHHLVVLDRDYTSAPQQQPWEQFYAESLVRRYG